MRRRVIHISEILTWADDFHRRNHRWPRHTDGAVAGQVDLTWCGVNQALQKGNRGLVPGSSLAKLLLEQRGVRHNTLVPDFTVEQILRWADAHHDEHGAWPTVLSGPIAGAPGETWLAVDKALRKGTRGMFGRSSLAQFLMDHRGVRNHAAAPQLSLKKVLTWADAYKQRRGKWPGRRSGAVTGVPGETWAAVDAAFVAGSRGLTGYASLICFLAKKRGARHRRNLADLTNEQILRWARAHHERTGKWPNPGSGAIEEAPGETWAGVHYALCHGRRGLRRSSLFRLLWKVRPRRKYRSATS